VSHDEAIAKAPSGPEAAQPLLEPTPDKTHEANKAAAALVLARELLDAPPLEVADVAADAERADAVAARSTALAARYGVRPRNYRKAFDNPPNPTYAAFATIVPRVTAFVNAQLKAAGSKLVLTEAEVANNFLAEGGVLLLQQQQQSGIDGFTYGGIDTIVARYASLSRYLHPLVQKKCEDPVHHKQAVNEKGEAVTSLLDLTLEETTYANAGMYAAMMRLVELDLLKRGIRLERLPDEARVFWATVYYNCGEGLGRTLLASKGVDWYKAPWTREDDFERYSRRPQFNAVLRTANYALLATDLDGPERGGKDGVEIPTAPTPKRRVDAASVLGPLDDEWAAVLELARGDRFLDSVSLATVREHLEQQRDALLHPEIRSEINARLEALWPFADQLGLLRDVFDALDPVYREQKHQRPEFGRLTLKSMAAELRRITKPADYEAMVSSLLAEIEYRLTWPPPGEGRTLISILVGPAQPAG